MEKLMAKQNPLTTQLARYPFATMPKFFCMLVHCLHSAQMQCPINKGTLTHPMLRYIVTFHYKAWEGNSGTGRQHHLSSFEGPNLRL